MLQKFSQPTEATSMTDNNPNPYGLALEKAADRLKQSSAPSAAHLLAIKNSACHDLADLHKKIDDSKAAQDEINTGLKDSLDLNEQEIKAQAEIIEKLRTSLELANVKIDAQAKIIDNMAREIAQAAHRSKDQESLTTTDTHAHELTERIRILEVLVGKMSEGQKGQNPIGGAGRHGHGTEESALNAMSGAPPNLISNQNTHQISDEHSTIISNNFSSSSIQVQIQEDTAQTAPTVCVLGLKSAVPMPTFSGLATEDFWTFARTFNDHINAAHPSPSEAQKVNALLTFLSGYARDLAGELLEKKPAHSLDSLTAEMRKTFENPCKMELNRQKVRHVAQRDDETVDEFLSRVRQLVYRAYSFAQHNAQEIIKDAFLEGLSKTIRFHVKGKTPTTLLEAYNAALTFEALLAEATDARTVDPATFAFLANQKKETLQCFHCNKFGHVAAECRARMAEESRQAEHHRNPAVQVINNIDQELAALRGQLAARDRQINELIKRNDTLAHQNVSAFSSRAYP